MKSQIIGIDAGRSYTKAFSVYGGNVYQTIFNSVYGNGRPNIDFNNYEQPIAVEIGGNDYFFGELAIKECYNRLSNLKDEKTTEVAEMLIIAALNKVAVTKEVKIMLGVPNRLYNKRTLQSVIDKYRNKAYVFRDIISGKTKEVHIVDIGIMRESDSALIFLERGNVNKKPIGLVSVGGKTTEISYYEPNFRFIDRNSVSLALGSIDVNTEVRRKLEYNRIYKSNDEIDISNNYDNKKKVAYEIIENRLYEEIDNIFTNISEMERIYIVGGTSQNLSLDDSVFTKVEDPQMVTAKGLYFCGNKRFNMEE